MNGAFKAIKRVTFPANDNLESLIVFVSADFTLSHIVLCFWVCLGMLDKILGLTLCEIHIIIEPRQNQIDALA